MFTCEVKCEWCFFSDFVVRWEMPGPQHKSDGCVPDQPSRWVDGETQDCQIPSLVSSATLELVCLNFWSDCVCYYEKKKCWPQFYFVFVFFSFNPAQSCVRIIHVIDLILSLYFMSSGMTCGIRCMTCQIMNRWCFYTCFFEIDILWMTCMSCFVSDSVYIVTIWCNIYESVISSVNTYLEWML